jgi:hypothetical protein
MQDTTKTKAGISKELRSIIWILVLGGLAPSTRQYYR